MPRFSPAVTVITASFNQENVIGALLEALSLQGFPLEYEVLICDNGSSDRTQRVVEQYGTKVPGLRLIDASARPGQCAARNVGVEYATAPLLAFIDGDDVPTESWLWNLVGAYEERVVVQGRLVPFDDRGSSPRFLRSPQGRGGLAWLSGGTLPYALGTNLLISRTALTLVGGWPEVYRGGGEDVYLSWALQDAGYALKYEASAVVRYRVRTGDVATFRQAVGYGKAHARLRRDMPHHFRQRRKGHLLVTASRSLLGLVAVIDPSRRRQALHRLGIVLGRILNASR